MAAGIIRMLCGTDSIYEKSYPQMYIGLQAGIQVAKGG